MNAYKSRDSLKLSIITGNTGGPKGGETSATISSDQFLLDIKYGDTVAPKGSLSARRASATTVRKIRHGIWAGNSRRAVKT
jgi:hypothetical protein